MLEQVSWYLEPHVIYVKYRGELTVGDLQAANDGIYELMVDGVPVHLLCDFTDVGKLPTDLLAISRIFSDLFRECGSVIVYGQSMVATVLTNSVARLTSKKVYIVKDLSAGLQKLKEVAPELREKPAT